MPSDAWIVFVTNSIGRLLEDYELDDFKHCRLTGTYEGHPCRVVRYDQLPKRLVGLSFDRVIWHGREPNVREREWVELRIEVKND